MPKSVGAKGDFGHFRLSEALSGTPVVAFDWQGITSY